MGVLACGPSNRAQRSVDAIRAELARRIPEAAPGELIVPWETGERHIEKARKAVAFGRSRRAQAEALIESLSNERFYGIVYSDWETLNAREALEVRRGNCFSFASILVGLGRALSMRAVYAEFSPDLDDIHRWDSLLVREGHITAMIALGRGQYTAMEFGAPIRFGRWRIISDLEATAHYYNNRGVERLLRAKRRRASIPWEEVARDLHIAARLVPTFYRAWNNLGVVTARLGRTNEAIDQYRRAIRHEPTSPAAYANLGALLFDLGRLDDAAPVLVRAAELDDDNAAIHHLLGAVRWKAGRPDLAVDSLERALAIDANHTAARRLLLTITEATTGNRAPEP